MGKIKLIVALGVAALAIILVLQNTGSVQTRLLFVSVAMPQAALLAITMLVGAGAGVLLAFSLDGNWTRKHMAYSPSHTQYADQGK